MENNHKYHIFTEKLDKFIDEYQEHGGMPDELVIIGWLKQYLPSWEREARRRHVRAELQKRYDKFSEVYKHLRDYAETEDRVMNTLLDELGCIVAGLMEFKD